MKRNKPLTDDERNTLRALEASYARRVKELEQLRESGNIKFQHALIRREEIFKLGRQINILKNREK